MNDKSNIPHLKKLLRVRAGEARRAACASAGADAPAALASLADLINVSPGDVVAGYWPMGDEMDPRPLMLELASRGARLALPVVVGRGQGLSFRSWVPGDALEPGEHGTFHPACDAPECLPALVLVPLLAFDRRGFRLGYGGGYYDRTLESLRASAHLTTMGVAYSAQEVDAVPHDDFDQRLDWVATENGLLKAEG